MMKVLKFSALIGMGLMASGCAAIEGGNREGAGRSLDAGTDAKHLSTLVAGVWVDPNGCDHWMIDDGVEGYLTERLTPDGRPVCSGVAPPNYVTGPFQDGSTIPDTL